MSLLIAGVVLFFAVHSISIVNEPWRHRMVEQHGKLRFKAVYSLIALAGLVLMIKGYGMARLDPTIIYTPPAWLGHLAMILLLPVFPLLVATYFPGRISRAVKNPMLIAVKLWALGHLLANGALADVILFGSFLAWAVADRISLKFRSPQSHPAIPEGSANDAIAVITGLGLYLAFVLWLHQWLIGVPPVAV
ncbi:NnrU family protein [Marinobacter sp.]|uniref:NnrU family protein n=1 Tax=Marinobacter sp. TaxID=50741 RepID=UPI00384DE098